MIQGRLADSGHYIAFGKVADGRWFQFDDDRVQVMKVRVPRGVALLTVLPSHGIRRIQFSGSMVVLGTARSRTYAFTRRRSWPLSESVAAT